MRDTRWTPIATRARHSFGQRRTSGACYPTRLDLRANQIGIMRALLKAAIEYGWDHVDPVTYPHQMHTHRLRERIDVTQAHLDAKLNAWHSNSAQAQQEPSTPKSIDPSVWRARAKPSNAAAQTDGRVRHARRNRPHHPGDRHSRLALEG